MASCNLLEHDKNACKNCIIKDLDKFNNFCNKDKYLYLLSFPKSQEVHLRYNATLNIYTLYTSNFDFSKDYPAEDPESWLEVLKEFKTQQSKIIRELEFLE